MIKIRKLQKSDEKQLLNLLIGLFKKNRDKTMRKRLLSIVKYKNYKNHLNKAVKKYITLRSKEAIIFVAENKNKLVGYIYGRVINKPHLILNKIGFIEDWFVEQNYRKQKIGWRLWNTLIDWFKKKKCNCLEVDTYATNKHAIGIYRKLGFMGKKISFIKRI